MNAEYDARIAYDLIEGTTHAACDSRLEAEHEIGMHRFIQAEKYQRRCRVMTAIALAISGVAVWMGLSR